MYSAPGYAGPRPWERPGGTPQGPAQGPAFPGFGLPPGQQQFQQSPMAPMQQQAFARQPVPQSGRSTPWQAMAPGLPNQPQARPPTITDAIQQPLPQQPLQPTAGEGIPQVPFSVTKVFKPYFTKAEVQAMGARQAGSVAIPRVLSTREQACIFMDRVGVRLGLYVLSLSSSDCLNWRAERFPMQPAKNYRDGAAVVPSLPPLLSDPRLLTLRRLPVMPAPLLQARRHAQEAAGDPSRRMASPQLCLVQRYRGRERRAGPGRHRGGQGQVCRVGAVAPRNRLLRLRRRQDGLRGRTRKGERRVCRRRRAWETNGCLEGVHQGGVPHRHRLVPYPRRTLPPTARHRPRSPLPRFLHRSRPSKFEAPRRIGCRRRRGQAGDPGVPAWVGAGLQRRHCRHRG